MKCTSGRARTNEYELSTFRTENANQNRHPLKRQDRTQSGITTAAMRRSRLSTNTMAVVECLLQAKLPPRYVKQKWCFVPSRWWILWFFLQRVFNHHKVGSWPWMASIGFYNERGDWVHKCGGSILSNFHILTAAHCVNAGMSYLIEQKPLSTVN